MRVASGPLACLPTLCTGDRQWIHVDADRASNESAVGGTIAHGFLGLSLIAPLGTDLGLAPVNASAVLNYGLDNVRFLKPVNSATAFAFSCP